MKTISTWGGLLGAFGGLIWAIMFFMEATNPEFDLRNLISNQPAPALFLVFSIMFQAAGFYSLSAISRDFPISRIGATVCALGAFLQSVALLASSSLFGLGAAWLLGILGELIITIALGIFAISSFSSKLPLTVKLIPLLMVPFYFVGWAFDPASRSVAGLDIVNLSAALYGLLWVPFGYVIWDYWRDRADRLWRHDMKNLRLFAFLSLLGGGGTILLVIFIAQAGWGPPGTAAYNQYELLNQLMAVALLGITAGWVGVWQIWPREHGRWTVTIALIGSAMMVLGNGAEFWLFSDQPYAEFNMRQVAFTTFSPGSLILDIGALLLGIMIWRSRFWPRWSAVVLLLALPFDLAAFFLFGTLFLPAALLALLIGYQLLTTNEVPRRIKTVDL